MKLRQLSVVCFVLPLVCFAQSTGSNSNYWPVHRDVQMGFRISYPPEWIIVPPKGANTRFAVSPRNGSGNCNVVARYMAELENMTQAAINREIESLPIDQASWAEYVGIPVSQIHLVQSRRAHIYDVPAVVGILETTLENLEGKFTRKQIVALTFTPGVIWSLNCGASTFKADEARSRFSELEPTFNKVFGSFAFVK
jgi:hypothetical protein